MRSPPGWCGKARAAVSVAIDQIRSTGATMGTGRPVDVSSISSRRCGDAVARRRRIPECLRRLGRASRPRRKMPTIEVRHACSAHPWHERSREIFRAVAVKSSPGRARSQGGVCIDHLETFNAVRLRDCVGPKEASTWRRQGRCRRFKSVNDNAGPENRRGRDFRVLPPTTRPCSQSVFDII